MKSLITFFTGLLALFAAFFWFCGRYAAMMPAPKNTAPPVPDAGQFTPNARRPPVGSRGPLYRVTEIGDIRPNPQMTMTTRLPTGSLTTQIKPTSRHDQALQNPKLRQFRPLPGYMGAVSVAGNTHGQIVGTLKLFGSGAWLVIEDHGFVWRQGRMHDLGSLPSYVISHAVAINDQGMIVGTALVDSFPGDVNIPSHAVCWIGGKVRDLGTGFAHAVNNAGDIVGGSPTGTPDCPREPHALLWTHGYRYDLNDFIPKNSGWLLAQATHIDGRGRITGDGTFHDQPRVFRLTPQKN